MLDFFFMHRNEIFNITYLRVWNKLPFQGDIESSELTMLWNVLSSSCINLDIQWTCCHGYIGKVKICCWWFKIGCQVLEHKVHQPKCCTQVHLRGTSTTSHLRGKPCNFFNFLMRIHLCFYLSNTLKAGLVLVTSAIRLTDTTRQSHLRE